MKFRKKPVVIEAVRFTASATACAEIEAFVSGDSEFRNGELIIATLEGPLRASLGDWIIKGIKGEFYPCKPDIFEATYEPVEDDPTADEILQYLEGEWGDGARFVESTEELGNKNIIKLSDGKGI